MLERIINYLYSNMLHTHPHAQVKSYARATRQRDENDKGYVSISYNEWVTGSYGSHSDRTHFYRLTITSAFVFLSILTPIVLAKLVSLHYPKIRTKASTEDLMRYLYWAAAGITFLVNVGYTLASLTHQYTLNHPSITSCIIQLPNHPCTIPSDTSVYYDEVLTLVAKCTIIPVAVLVELLISMYTVKKHYDTKQRYVGCRCSSVKHYLQLSFHILALWNFLTAVQLFTMIAVPLGVLLPIHPQVTIVYIITLLLTTVGLALIVAYVLYQCQQPRRRNFQSSVRCYGSMCVYFVVITATIGLILAFLVLYELMLLVQVQIGTGLKGVFLSLLPSFPLSALGWYVKKRSQRKKRTRGRSETDLEEELLMPKEHSSITENSDSDLIRL